MPRLSPLPKLRLVWEYARFKLAVKAVEKMGAGRMPARLFPWKRKVFSPKLTQRFEGLKRRGHYSPAKTASLETGLLFLVGRSADSHRRPGLGSQRHKRHAGRKQRRPQSKVCAQGHCSLRPRGVAGEWGNCG